MHFGMNKFKKLKSIRIYQKEMAKKCIYCASEISEQSVIDFCERCGVGVWGPKMFKTIVQNMEQARDQGNI